MPTVKELILDANKAWEGDQALPTGTLMLNDGIISDRVIPAGGQLSAEFKFLEAVNPGPVELTLVIGFGRATGRVATRVRSGAAASGQAILKLAGGKYHPSHRPEGERAKAPFGRVFAPYAGGRSVGRQVLSPL